MYKITLLLFFLQSIYFELIKVDNNNKSLSDLFIKKRKKIIFLA